MAPLIKFVPAAFLPGAEAAATAIQKMEFTLIAAHTNPDGDAIGSMSACGWILKHLGHKFALFNTSGVPSSLEFLPLPGPIYRNLADLPFEPKSAIFVDCSDVGRLGSELAPYWDKWPSLNIDHHLCDKGLGSLANYIDTSAAATCQLVAYLSLALGIPLTKTLAESVGIGLLTDTGNFTHNNSDANVFLLAALLEQEGCSLPTLGENLRSNWQLRKMHLWGELFAHVRQSDDGQIAWSVITSEVMKKYNCNGEDIEGYIDWLRRLKGVEVAITVRESESRNNEAPQIKFSLRSKRGINVQKIAAEFGGGGHKNAAGGSIAGTPEHALEKLLAAVKEALSLPS